MPMGRITRPSMNGGRTIPYFVEMWLDKMLERAAVKRNGMTSAADKIEDLPTT